MVDFKLLLNRPITKQPDIIRRRCNKQIVINNNVTFNGLYVSRVCEQINEINDNFV